MTELQSFVIMKTRNILRSIYPVTVIFGAACSGFKQTPGIPTPVKQTAPTSTVVKPSWHIDPALSNIAIIVLDYQTLEFESAYFPQQEPCSSSQPPLSDEELAARAGSVFDAAGSGGPHIIITDDQGNHEGNLDFKIKYVGDFAIFEKYPGDFGGFAVLHRCSGSVLYSGSIVWMGTGEQIYPEKPINPGELSHQNTPLLFSENVDVVIGPYALNVREETGITAWMSVQDLNIVQELAQSPYEVLVYLYPRTVGMFDPATAKWVVFVQRNPGT